MKKESKIILIGVAGKKRAGKNVISDYLVGNHGFKSYAFADPIKRAAMELFGFTEAQMWGSTEEKEAIDKNWNISPRRMLQVMGTELFQFDIHKYLNENEFKVGREVWVKRFLIWFEEEKKKHIEANEDLKIVISDVRFQHEFTNLKAIGGNVWKVSRPSLENNDSHSSEMEMDLIVPDVEIVNNSTLENLYITVDNILCPQLSQ